MTKIQNIIRHYQVDMTLVTNLAYLNLQKIIRQIC
jgi:hypothetical protein